MKSDSHLQPQNSGFIEWSSDVSDSDQRCDWLDAGIQVEWKGVLTSPIDVRVPVESDGVLISQILINIDVASCGFSSKLTA